MKKNRKIIGLSFISIMILAPSIEAKDTVDYAGHALLSLNHIYAYHNNGSRYPLKDGACLHYFQNKYGADQMYAFFDYNINLSSYIMRADAIVDHAGYKLNPIGTAGTIGFLNQTRTDSQPEVFFSIRLNDKKANAHVVFDTVNKSYQCSFST